LSKFRSSVKSCPQKWKTRQLRRAGSMKIYRDARLAVRPS
jgi:hypothetical protein